MYDELKEALEAGLRKDRNRTVEISPSGVRLINPDGDDLLKFLKHGQWYQVKLSTSLNGSVRFIDRAMLTNVEVAQERVPFLHRGQKVFAAGPKDMWLDFVADNEEILHVNYHQILEIGIVA